MTSQKSSGAEFIHKLVDSMNRKSAIEALIKSNISVEIIRSRFEKKMNQAEFAEFMGVSQTMVSKWESCDCNFTVASIASICEKLELVPDLIIRREDEYLAIRNNSWEDMDSAGFEESEELALAS